MFTQWRDAYITIRDGAELHYYRTGNGDKPVLVLCHGFSDNGMCWQPVAQELEADYDIILPDARGHGLSQRVKPGEKLDLKQDLLGLIEALGLDRPIIGGHSMGGSTASSFEASYPGIARALILEDPGWRDLPPGKPEGEKPPAADPWIEWLASLPGKTIEEVLQKGRADNPTWAEVEMRPWAESKKALDLNIFRAESTPLNWREVVTKIHAPTLLLTADVESGGMVSAEMASFAMQSSPAIRRVHIGGAGHNIRRENYTAYIEAVRKFLAELD